MKMFATLLVLALTAGLAAGGVQAQETQLPPDTGLQKHSFEGFIEWMPQHGFVGEWVIGGYRVTVTPRTEINMKHGPPTVGALVHVRAMEYRGQMLAYKIRVKKPKLK
ncbi:MAG: hypothetical protein FJ128_04325 [Deltaproteobacteria bacterium]|nr:hypothetical protein [Deltaproteobacteria bacterium]